MLPVSNTRHGSFLVFGSAVHRQQLGERVNKATFNDVMLKTAQYFTSLKRTFNPSVQSHLAASSLQHLSIADRLFHLLEHADLTCDGHRELFVG